MSRGAPLRRRREAAASSIGATCECGTPVWSPRPSAGPRGSACPCYAADAPCDSRAWSPVNDAGQRNRELPARSWVSSHETADRSAPRLPGAAQSALRPRACVGRIPRLCRFRGAGAGRGSREQPETPGLVPSERLVSVGGDARVSGEADVRDSGTHQTAPLALRREPKRPRPWLRPPWRVICPSGSVVSMGCPSAPIGSGGVDRG